MSARMHPSKNKIVSSIGLCYLGTTQLNALGLQILVPSLNLIFVNAREKML